MAINKYVRRRKILKGQDRLRLVVSRSHNAIVAQIIDDSNGVTLVSATSIKSKNGGNVESAFSTGVDLGKKAKESNISSVWFDRNNYLYTGRVKALADGARKSGLKF
ncbi:50S ribosomal protein L18 [bacterium]|jgi:large subunit ribosomal protein L18|nr:50S ribosomal protein L18 [bacterium]